MEATERRVIIPQVVRRLNRDLREALRKAEADSDQLDVEGKVYFAVLRESIHRDLARLIKRIEDFDVAVATPRIEKEDKLEYTATQVTADVRNRILECLESWPELGSFEAVHNVDCEGTTELQLFFPELDHRLAAPPVYVRISPSNEGFLG